MLKVGMPHLDGEDVGLVGVLVRVSRAVPSVEPFEMKRTERKTSHYAHHPTPARLDPSHPRVFESRRC